MPQHPWTAGTRTVVYAKAVEGAADASNGWAFVECILPCGHTCEWMIANGAVQDGMVLIWKEVAP